MREDLNRNGTYEVVTYKLGTIANGDKTEAIIGSILEYLCTKVQRKVNMVKCLTYLLKSFLFFRKIILIFAEQYKKGVKIWYRINQRSFENIPSASLTA